MVGAPLKRCVLLCCCGAAIVRSAIAELVPGLLELDVVLAPSDPYHVRVGVGQAKFLRLTCMGGPADVVVSLSTYSERADPLLFLSLNPDEAPSFSRHDASSFGQWREDAVGNHYAIAKNVGPRGGILGLVNMRHFAGEELDGVLSVHCSFIIAFDAMFWDHVRSSALCPIGERVRGGHLDRSDVFCSGHGTCGKHGLCKCYADWEGPACEHAKTDIVTAAEGRYRFKVSTGHYQYFRVHIPPRFPGGFLEVKTSAEMPLVVLVKSNGLPTKGSFERSNFDQWVSARNTSVLRYKVAASDNVRLARDEDLYDTPFAFGNHMEDGTYPGRRLEGEATKTAPLRGLMPLSHASRIHCPPATELPHGYSLACETASVAHCTSSCMTCIGCSKGAKESDNGACGGACDTCSSPACLRALSICAGNVSCMGIPAQRCDDGCGACMTCFDSNDRGCGDCQCCLGCLPLAAKCGAMAQQKSAMNSRFVFVGVYNHRRYFNERVDVTAVSDVKLTADPEYSRDELPTSWLAELYDPFHDIGSLEITQSQNYPDGQQFIYELPLGDSETLDLEVRIFRDRVTLVHIGNEARAEFISLGMTGPNITHILTSSRASPKTLFDFDQVPLFGGEFKNSKKGDPLQIRASGQPSLWCAIFGSRDGFVRISARTYGGSHSLSDVATQAPAVGAALLFAAGLLCCGLVVFLGAAQSGKLADLFTSFGGNQMGVDTSVAAPLQQRFGGLASTCNAENNAEDQYLHRGGFGDDGM